MTNDALNAVLGESFKESLISMSILSILSFIVIMSIWIHVVIKSKFGKKKLNNKLLYINSILYFLFGFSALIYGVFRSNFLFDWRIIGVPCIYVYFISLSFWSAGKTIMSIFFVLKLIVSFKGSIFEVTTKCKYIMSFGIGIYYFVGLIGWILFTVYEQTLPKWTLVGQSNDKDWYVCFSDADTFSDIQKLFIIFVLSIPEATFQMIICYMFVSRLVKVRYIVIYI